MADKVPSVYSLLVKAKDDFLGLFAYSVYRRQKDGLSKEQETGVDDNLNARVQAFEKLSCTEAQLEHYREQALKLAALFTDSLLSEEIEAIQKKLEAEYYTKWKASRPSFWAGVWASVVASFVFTLLLGMFVFLTWSLKQGPRQVIENIFNVKITAADSGKGVPAATSSTSEPVPTPSMGLAPPKEKD